MRNKKGQFVKIRTNKFCSECEEEFYPRKETSIYCSKSCASKNNRPGIEGRKKLSEINKGNKHCLGRKINEEMRIKIGKSNSGKKSHFWRGGNTEIVKSLRTSYKYKEWRTKVFERDNYNCKNCKERGGKLNADHYKERFADMVYRLRIKNREQAYKYQELWDISNGRTLCESCHRKTDNFGIKLFNAKEKLCLV